MSWANNHITNLSKGLSVTIKSNCKNLNLFYRDIDSVIIHPLEESNLAIGDNILCKVRGNIAFRKIRFIKENVFTVSDISNNLYGRITKAFIYGKCIASLEG